MKTIGAATCIRNAEGAEPHERNIMVSQADYDELCALGQITFFRAAGMPHDQSLTPVLRGLTVAIMGEPLRFEAKPARSNGTENAISATDAIGFAIQIEDHFDRLQWLMDWRDGVWGEMRRSYPAFDVGAWREPS